MLRDPDRDGDEPRGTESGLSSPVPSSGGKSPFAPGLTLGSTCFDEGGSSGGDAAGSAGALTEKVRLTISWMLTEQVRTGNDSFGREAHILQAWLEEATSSGLL